MALTICFVLALSQMRPLLAKLTAVVCVRLAATLLHVEMVAPPSHQTRLVRCLVSGSPVFLAPSQAKNAGRVVQIIMGENTWEMRTLPKQQYEWNTSTRTL